MLKTIKFWLESSRWYALPMSFFSWLVIFVYCAKLGGNVSYGILALFGVCLAHLCTNLFDDFYDFIKLKKNIENEKLELPNTQRGKCRYILEKKTTLYNVFGVIIFYCAFAFAIGIFFYFKVGTDVLWFMAGGGFIIFSYSVFSYYRLSELLVSLAFGPLLYGGIFYVMMGKISVEPFILAIPTTIFTINLLYTDMFLDRNLDFSEGKKTFVGIFKSEKSAINFQKILLAFGYFSLILPYIFNVVSSKIILGCLTLPLAVDLIKSLKEYSKSSKNVPQKKWYHFPFEDWNDIEENRSAPFMFRIYQARNLMCYTGIILSIILFFQ